LTALGWAGVQTRVAEADDFLLATTDPDGRPHVVPGCFRSSIRGGIRSSGMASSSIRPTLPQRSPVRLRRGAGAGVRIR